MSESDPNTTMKPTMPKRSGFDEDAYLQLHPDVAAAVTAALRRDFERARDRHVSAQRRWARATQEVMRADEECRRIDQAFRAGLCSVLGLAQARWHRQRQVESQLHAEADRLVSQHVMDLLARPASALTVV